MLKPRMPATIQIARHWISSTVLAAVNVSGHCLVTVLQEV